MSNSKNGGEKKVRSMSLQDIQDIYADEADMMARMEWLNRIFSGRYRSKIYSEASGRVLDVACGTGINRHYIPENIEYQGIDISREILEKAEKNSEELEIGRNLQQMDAQNLEFEENSFDTVISALSTCTFPEPVKALNEMARVCKPKGKVLLFEHGRSSVRPISRFQYWRSEAHYRKHGCRWTQEPLELLKESKLKAIKFNKHFLGIITLIKAKPEQA